MIRNPPANIGNMGLIPGLGPKISYAMGQLSPCATTTEPAQALWSPYWATGETTAMRSQ